MITKLNGYKTYIVALLVGVASALHYMGWIDSEAYNIILGLLIGTGMATIRHGISALRK